MLTIASCLPCPSRRHPDSLDEADGGSPLFVGEVVVQYQAHAETHYARDGVPTGEHVTVRGSLQPLIDRFSRLRITGIRTEEAQAGPRGHDQARLEPAILQQSDGNHQAVFRLGGRGRADGAEVSNGLVPVMGLKKGRTEAREKVPIGPVDDAHVGAMLPKVSALVADTLRTMRLTGMRPGEALMITPEEIDRTDPSCWLYKPEHHKTAHLDQPEWYSSGRRHKESSCRGS